MYLRMNDIAFKTGDDELITCSHTSVNIQRMVG